MIKGGSLATMIKGGSLATMIKGLKGACWLQ